MESGGPVYQTLVRKHFWAMMRKLLTFGFKLTKELKKCE